MGEFLSKHFVAGWKKLGTFTINNYPCMNRNPVEKVGGNVVAYFCTPDLTILHAVWGPESAGHFLEQAKWAVALAEKLRDAPAAERSGIARTAHEENPYRYQNMWSLNGVKHLEQYKHLAEKALLPLNRATAEELFLKLVNEKASDEDVRIVDGTGLFGAPTPSCRRRP